MYWELWCYRCSPVIGGTPTSTRSGATASIRSCGMRGVASEDSVRRAMKAMDEAASGQWIKRQLKASYEPLLQEPWVLDVDTTVKPLYGHQQDAKVGYNPTKPGRPYNGFT